MNDPLVDRPEISSPQVVTFDAILPATMAARAEESGVKRAAMAPLTLLILSVLGGAFIAFGAIFATTVSAGTAELSYGVARLLSALVFPVGLILIVVAGAELFTGNNLIVMAWANGKVKTRHVLSQLDHYLRREFYRCADDGRTDVFHSPVHLR